MKKILSIFLCLIFICSITSCDTKEHSSENNDTEENTVTTVKSDEIQIATPKPATDYKKAYLIKNYGFSSLKKTLHGRRCAEI